MNTDYHDILSRIPTPPLWFDEHAVPRFDPFAPSLLADIYASECALISIACQGCSRPFLVAISNSDTQGYLAAMCRAPATIEYGDPPNVDCCATGPTMNSIPLAVIEFWTRKLRTFDGWTRVPTYERAIR